MNNIFATKSTSSCRIKGVLDERGKIVNDQKCEGNLTKKIFVSIADKLLKERKDVDDVKNNEYLSDSVKNYFVCNEICDSEIQNYIKTMNTIKSVRSDVPSICFVKFSAKIISPYLSKLYKKCVKYGVFPELLKFAEVIPIYKSGFKNEINKYRPHSLLSPFSKNLVLSV